MIIERGGPKESIEQYNSTEEHNQQKTQIESQEHNQQEAESTEDNRNRTQVKHSIYDVVNRRTRSNIV